MWKISTILASIIVALVQSQDIGDTSLTTTTTEGNPQPLETIEPEIFNQFFIQVSRDELKVAFAKMMKSVEEAARRKFFAVSCITDAEQGFEQLLEGTDRPLADCYKVVMSHEIIDILDCQAEIVGWALGNASEIATKSQECVGSTWL